MPLSGAHRRYSVVCEQAAISSHKMDGSLWKTLSLFDFYIHNTIKFRQQCRLGHTAEQCRSGLFQDSDFAGDLEVSKSTSGGILCIFGRRTFVPINWMCTKQAAVSHSSAESDVITLDAGLRRDGIRALDLWDWVVEVLHSSPKGDWARGDLKRKECETHHKGRTKTKSLTSEESCLREIDYVTPNVTLSRQNALLYIL